MAPQPPTLRDGQRRADAEGRLWVVENGRWRREAPWETAGVGLRETLADAGRFVNRELQPRLDAVFAPTTERPPVRRLPMVPDFVAEGRRPAEPPLGGLLSPRVEPARPAEPRGFDVDRKFLVEREAKGGVPALSIYVPTYNDRPDVVIENSGPTIGAGVDLGGKDAAYLRRVGVDPAVIAKLEPYFGKSRQEALDFVRANPLTLSEQDVAALDAAIQDDHIGEIAKNFDADSKVGRFDQLPRGAQTAIASLYFQYGPNKPGESTPNYWRQITTGDWEGAERNLRDFGDAYRSRRGLEADLLRKDLRAGTLPRAPR